MKEKDFYDNDGLRVTTVFESMGAAIFVASRLNMGDEEGWAFVAERFGLDKGLIKCTDGGGDFVGYF